MLAQQLPTDYQNFIHKSRYARFLESEGRRENWDETVTRYFDYFEEDLEERHGYKVSGNLRSELADAVSNLQIMPSMRALMTAGEAARRENICVYNCAYLPIDRPKAFAEALYILMCGTGVGFSVERQIIKRLPEVPNELTQTGDEIIVEDSKRGWSQAYLELIEALYAGRVPHVRTHLVRGAGERLRTFGGRASGPAPFVSLCEFTIRSFMAAKGRNLNSLEVHELICKVGEIVVVGGVRRSAEISLSNLSDQRMRNAKSGDWYTHKPWLGLANNSAAYTEKPDVGIWMDEWASLYNSKSGERGIFNRYGAIEKIQNLGRRDHNYEFGTNPCVTGDTRLLTRKGWFAIETLVGKEVEIWNGKTWSKVTPFSTGYNPVYETLLSNGELIRSTPYHGWAITPNSRKTRKGLFEHPNFQSGFRYLRKKKTKDLEIGDQLSKFAIPEAVEFETTDSKVDAYSQGFYSGDGLKDGRASFIYRPKFSVVDRVKGEVSDFQPEDERVYWKHGVMDPKFQVPLNSSTVYRLNWLAGLLDSDGCSIRMTSSTDFSSLQITSVELGFLRDVRRLLFSLGCQSHLEISEEGNWGFIGEDIGDRSWFKPCHRLVISQVDTQILMDLGLKTERLVISQGTGKLDSRRKRYVKVVGNELVGEEETFCVTEPEIGMCTFETSTTFNCGEIVLRPRGLCNLSEVILRDTDSFGEIKDKIRLASVLGTWQSTQTRFKFVEPEWQINANEERLLGVSLTGIFDNSLMRGDSGLDKLSRKLQEAKSTAIKANRIEAHEIGVTPSVAVTTVKPSGTVSQLAQCSSGIHPGHAPYYLRRVSQDNKDPITMFMSDAGVQNIPHPTHPQETTIFTFPIKLGKTTRTREEFTAIEHMELVKCYNENWSEHAVSCTISVMEHEWPEVGGWVYKNFDDLAGMSFLPYFSGDSSYAQEMLPYLEVGKPDYDAYVKAYVPEVTWSDLGNYERGVDSVTGTREFACVGNTCEVIESSNPL